MKLYTFILLGLFVMGGSAQAGVPWSTVAHDDLIDSAFGNERADCTEQIKAGSLWVDNLDNQAPLYSYRHAMRASSQSVQAAKNLMADWIQEEYELAYFLLGKSTVPLNASPEDPLIQVTNNQRLIIQMDGYLQYCYHRGRALHSVMDSTSPAHADFAIWSPIEISQVMLHGDFHDSIENLQVLIENPDLKTKTVGLMQLVQKMYIDLNIREFRFE